ncbi:Beta-galactosidase C-terminal domain [Paenibacillus sp. N3.4]|uniref:Beta-galactosidase C-terminal domain n=1 Tax=Paenibacillus sp. N3.4 TaxID=2603222 RepID=UPI00164F6A21|nr:Beta-galactosidase C-terminal domain [Paenibacillus sp. N3.4]
MPTNLPNEVTVQIRTDGVNDYVFVLNFSRKEQTILLDNRVYTDMLNADREEVLQAKDAVQIKPYGVRILKRSKQE